MLTRVRVDNFRCLLDFDCQLGATQLILGPNGAGKTTIFEILALLRDCCIRGEPLDGRLGGRSRTRWRSKDTQQFELEVLGNGGKYHFLLQVDGYGNPERPRILRESVTFSDRRIFHFELGDVHLFNDAFEEKVKYPFDWHRSALATVVERPENTLLTWFKRWLGGVLVISPDPRQMSGLAEQEAKYPDEDLANFGDWYRHAVQESPDFINAAFADDLREVILGFTTIRLEHSGEGRREIKLRMADRLSKVPDHRGDEYLFRELSDGQRVLVGLHAVLHFAMNPDTTLCFDEPDNFIALAEIEPWMTKLLDRAEELQTAQVLIVSHHPELLNRMAFHHGIHLDRPQGKEVRVRHFADPSQTGLTAAELIARGWENE